VPADALPAGALTPPLSRLLGDPARLTAVPLRHNLGNGVTAGIWRVAGPSGTAVLKVTTPHGDPAGPWAAGRSPGHWNYWRREALAYRTGLAAGAYAPAGVRAPRLLDALERPDGSVALWLEDARGAPGTAWTVEELAGFARRLGVAQARWIGRPPGHPWLSRRWLRAYVGSRPVAEPVAWDHPAAVAAWPAPLRAQLRQLWQRRADLLDAVERLPQTLCHLDVWPPNLVGDGEETILLDWAFVGSGAVGEDVGNLVPDSVADGLLDPGLLPELSEAVGESYRQGLARAGRPGPAGLVRRGIAAAGAAKYCWLAPTMLARLARGQRVGSPSYDPASSDEEVLARRAGMFALLTAWARVALD